MTRTQIAVLGAAGKIGFATASALRAAGVAVKAVVRDSARADPLRALGCAIGEADLRDLSGLTAQLVDVEAVQVILPPPPQAEDATAEMRAIISCLSQALADAKPARVVAISDYGAHLDENVGMPFMFRIFEEHLRPLRLDLTIVRSAEHMEGWGPFIPGAIESGVLPSLHHPVTAEFPTVSAAEVGDMTARFLLDDGGSQGGERLVHVEGPRRYSAADVAVALTQLTGRAITAVELPESQWGDVLGVGLSASAAQLVADVYVAHNKGGLIDVECGRGELRRGQTELRDALQPLVRSA